MPRKRKAYPLLHLPYRPNTDDGKLVARLQELGYTKTDVMRAGLKALRNQLGGYGAEPARVMTELLGGEE